MTRRALRAENARLADVVESQRAIIADLGRQLLAAQGRALADTAPMPRYRSGPVPGWHAHDGMVTPWAGGGR